MTLLAVVTNQRRDVAFVRQVNGLLDRHFL